MEPEPYSDQLIKALRQLSTRVNEVKGQPNGQIPPESLSELIQMRTDARKICDAWCAARRPPPLSYGASVQEAYERSRITWDLTMQDNELGVALSAIGLDFPVEAIDNAIHVAESQA
jgi:hypothetical protein